MTDTEPTPLPEPEEDDADSLERVLAARHTPRRRMAQAGSAVAVVLVALLVVVGGFPAVGRAVAALGALVLPPPLPPGADQLYIAPAVPWSSVTIDGQAVSPPIIGPAEPLRLSRGKHVVRWTAAPFAPHQCTLTIPSLPNRDTCAVAAQPAVHAIHGPAIPVIDLPETLDDLSGAQRASLLDAMHALPDTFTTDVLPGEQYLSDADGRVTARAPVHATLTYTLDAGSQPPQPVRCQLYAAISDISPCQVGGLDCVDLCTVPWPQRDVVASMDRWNILAPVRLKWSYASDDGRVTLAGQPVDAGGASVADHLRLFSLAWDGQQWHADALTGPREGPPIYDGGFQLQDDPACAAAQDLVFGGTSPPSPFASARFVSDVNPADGCLALATPRAPGGGTLPEEEFLVRFGLITPVNAPARHVLDHLRAADPAEQALAQAVESFSGQTVSLPGG